MIEHGDMADGEYLMLGMCMAINLLKDYNIRNFVLLEKSGGFGGTWRDNAFPGSCCDVFSHLYCYSFETNPDWSRVYPGQEEILTYLTKVAQKYELYRYTRFNTSVDEARWDDNEKLWTVRVRVGGGKDAEFGSTYTISTPFLISGVGQLNQPRGIDVEGVDDYTGKLMHSARWDWSYDVRGKKIAVIGNGATSAQIVPEVAKVASHLTVVQRSPGWVVPRHDAAIPEWQRQAMKWVPPLLWRHRAECMDIRESFYPAVTQSTSKTAEHFVHLNQTMMQSQLPNRPDLWKILTPSYKPGCKRSVISDDYYPTLIKPNVRLETAKIEKFTPEGIKFADKDQPEQYDLIVLATGFEALSFLAPMKIYGRNGKPLDEIWSTAAHAYKGVTVEDVPNFGMLYGPNSNLSHNSLILVIEAQARYIARLVDRVLGERVVGGSMALWPKTEVVEEYNQMIQKGRCSPRVSYAIAVDAYATVAAELQATSFSDPSCTCWWKRDDGVIINNWSRTAIDYQKMMSSIDYADYEIEGIKDPSALSTLR